MDLLVQGRVSGFDFIARKNDFFYLFLVSHHVCPVENRRSLHVEMESTQVVKDYALSVFLHRDVCNSSIFSFEASMAYKF